MKLPMEIYSLKHKNSELKKLIDNNSNQNDYEESIDEPADAFNKHCLKRKFYSPNAKLLALKEWDNAKIDRTILCEFCRNSVYKKAALLIG